NRPRSPVSRYRRGTERVMRAAGSDTTATVRPYPVTSTPTAESDTPRSAAINDSRPTGRFSAVLKVNAASINAATTAALRQGVARMLPIQRSSGVSGTARQGRGQRGGTGARLLLFRSRPNRVRSGALPDVAVPL